MRDDILRILGINKFVCLFLSQMQREQADQDFWGQGQDRNGSFGTVETPQRCGRGAYVAVHIGQNPSVAP